LFLIEISIGIDKKRKIKFKIKLICYTLYVMIAGRKLKERVNGWESNNLGSRD